MCTDVYLSSESEDFWEGGSLRKLRHLRCSEDGTLIKWDDKKGVYRCAYGHVFSAVEDDNSIEGDLELSDEVVW